MEAKTGLAALGLGLQQQVEVSSEAMQEVQQQQQLLPVVALVVSVQPETLEASVAPITPPVEASSATRLLLLLALAPALAVQLVQRVALAQAAAALAQVALLVSVAEVELRSSRLFLLQMVPVARHSALSPKRMETRV